MQAKPEVMEVSVSRKVQHSFPKRGREGGGSKAVWYFTKIHYSFFQAQESLTDTSL